MATRPSITVLIPTYNRAEYLEECLESLLTQTISASQIIIVNDGSTDHTREVLNPYMDRVDYLETQQCGKPLALNRGLAEVTGDYLWIFDDDDVALPDALERFVTPLERHPQYGFSFSSFYFTDTCPETGRIGSVKHRMHIPDTEKRGLLIPLMEANFIGGAALFARTSCYERVGTFEPQLVRSQDYDMVLRIAREFRGVQVTGDPTFHYRQHGGLRGSTQDRFQAKLKRKKWLKYDQVIFRQLYRQLPLAEYLPPGCSLKDSRRYALLQRMKIMASKLLNREVLSDLHQLAALRDESDFSNQERSVVRSLFQRPFYDVGCLYDEIKLFRAIGRLARTSATLRILRSELLHALVTYSTANGRRNLPLRTVKSVRRAGHLYFPAFMGGRYTEWASKFT